LFSLPAFDPEWHRGVALPVTYNVRFAIPMNPC
jgi:hypothetical protein